MGLQKVQLERHTTLQICYQGGRDRYKHMDPSYFPIVLLHVNSCHVFPQETEITERVRKGDQEFDELVSFIHQRVTQTEVT